MNKLIAKLGLNKSSKAMVIDMYGDHPADTERLLELAVRMMEEKDVKLTGVDIVYALRLLDQFRSAAQDKGPKLTIDANFFPSARLTAAGRAKLMGAIEYGEIESNASFAETARDKVLMILNAMDGGIGSSLKRKAHLKDAAGQVEDVSRTDLGAKSTDLFFTVEKGAKQGLVSIAEAKLMHSIELARQGRIAKLVVQSLVSTVTKGAFEELLDRTCFEDRMNGLAKRNGGRTYRQLVGQTKGIDLADMLVQGVLPTVDVERDELTTDRLAPGGHGEWGVRLLLDAMNDELPLILPNDDKSLITAIYNGDGINNFPDPTMVGWMHSNRVPIVMVTTTKTGLDLKGGQLGVVHSGGKTWTDIMELAQAESPGQQILFQEMGITQGNPGAQYFNTNMLMFNWSVLVPFLKALGTAIGEKQFYRIISPTLIRNKKSQDGRDFIQLEGGIGSVVWSLNAFLAKTDNRDVNALVADHRIGQVVRILNVAADDRTRFFTPVKSPADFWLQFHSDSFDFDTNNWRIISKCSGRVPSVKLTDGYYQDTVSVLESFEGTSVIGLEKLEIAGRVSLAGAQLRGKVIVDSRYDGVADVRSGLGLSVAEEILLDDVHIFIDTKGEVKVASLKGEDA